jgi:bla regulator protein BlaR1
MTPFLLYQLKAGLCIMLFTGLYYALFRKETFYRFNRFYLVGSLELSFIIPAIQFPPVTVSGNLPAFITFIGEVTVYANSHVHAANVPAERTIPLLWQVYRLVSLFMVAILIYQLIALIMLLQRRVTHSHGAYRIITLPENKNPLSTTG